MPTLRQIRYFLAAAESGQVTAAAAALFVSQSAVTRAIKDLEGELGVALVERRPGGIALTREGQHFLAHARNVEGAVADAMRSLRRETSELAGRVRLGLSYTTAGYFALPLVARFRRAYPGVALSFREAERPRLEEMLRRDQLDLAVLLVSNLTRRGGTACRTLVRSPRRLWLSSTHPLTRRDRVSLAEVARNPYVLYLADEVEESTRRYWRRAGLAPRVVLRTSSLEAVRSMVALGEAVTILSDLVHRPWSLDGGRVEVRPVTPAVPSMDIGVAWAEGRELAPPARRLLDYLRAAVGTGGPPRR